MRRGHTVTSVAVKRTMKKKTDSSKTKSSAPTTFAGPFSLRRLPVKGWLLTTDGIEDNAIYYDDDAEAKKGILHYIATSTTIQTEERANLNVYLNGLALSAVDKWGWTPYLKHNREAAMKYMSSHQPAFHCLRVVGAYLCSYGDTGMIVLKDMESVALMLDEFFVAPASNDDLEWVEKNKKEMEESKKSGPLTPEEIEEMLREAAQGISVVASEHQSQDQKL